MWFVVGEILCCLPVVFGLLESLLLCDVRVCSWCIGINEAQDVLVELIKFLVSLVQTVFISQITGKHRIRWNHESRGPCQNMQPSFDNICWSTESLFITNKYGHDKAYNKELPKL